MSQGATFVEKRPRIFPTCYTDDYHINFSCSQCSPIGNCSSELRNTADLMTKHCHIIHVFEFSHRITLRHLSSLILFVPLHLFLIVGSRCWLAKSSSWMEHHNFGLAKIPFSIGQNPIVGKKCCCWRTNINIQTQF